MGRLSALNLWDGITRQGGKVGIMGVTGRRGEREYLQDSPRSRNIAVQSHTPVRERSRKMVPFSSSERHSTTDAH
jgi:hypothetical protein